MDREYERYSLAWVPVPGTALAEFGKQWTGWCSVSGQATTAREEWVALRTAARVGRLPEPCGLHAPLTKPFAPGDGVSYWSLETMLEEFANAHASEYVSPPVLRVENDRVVMIPNRRTSGLNSMMADLQEELRPFVAFESGPAPQRFGLPLTGMLSPRAADLVLMELAPMLDGIVGPDPLIASICLMGQPCKGHSWRMLNRYVLPGQFVAVERGPAEMTCIGPDLSAPVMAF